MLVFLAGLLIHIPVISAQEESQTGAADQVAEGEILSPGEDPLRAAEQAFTFPESTETVSPAPASSTWIVIRMLLVLALAAAAIYGVVFFIKRSAKPAAAKDPFLKVIATAHLGSSRYAHIVSVGSKAWLLGSSDGGVNLIGEVDDKDVINAMLLEDSKKEAESASGRFPDFLSMLRRLGTPADNRASGADEIRRRRERLKGL